MRQNKLEAALFDLTEKVDRVMEGVEEDYHGTAAKLEPALKELDIQFDSIDDL